MVSYTIHRNFFSDFFYVYDPLNKKVLRFNHWMMILIPILDMLYVTKALTEAVCKIKFQIFYNTALAWKIIENICKPVFREDN